MLKAAIKHATAEDSVRHRQVPAETITRWAKKLVSLKKEIAEVLQDEKEEKHVCASRLTGLKQLILAFSFVKQKWNSEKVKT